jgi:PAS domain S-box-containing protein
VKRFVPKMLYRFNRAAWVALGVSLSLVLLANHVFYLQASKLGEQQFEVNVKEVVQAIDERMRQHAQILQGGAGLFNASVSVDRVTWQRYIESLRLDQNNRGLEGMVYSEVITPAHLEIRSQALRAESYSEFKLYPAGVRSIYSAVVYLEPMSERNRRVIGYDMLTDPSRGAAMRRAAETGMTTLSEKISLRIDPDGSKPAGLVMCLPVYQKQQELVTLNDRWHALQGFVCMVFRTQELMRGLLGERERPLKFQIFDGLQPKSDMLLFDSTSVTHLGHEHHIASQWATNRVISAYGRDWTVQFQSRPSIETSWVSLRNSAVLVLGTGLSLLLFLFIAVLSSRRARAESMAQDMTQELWSQTLHLHESQQMLDVIVDNIPVGVSVKDAHSFRYELVNRAWREIYELPDQDLIGKTVYEIFDRPLAQDLAENDQKAYESDQVHVIEEGNMRTPLGHERVLKKLTVHVRNEAGNTAHLLGISIDITNQVLARTAMKESAQLMQVVLDNVADGIVTLNSEGLVQSMNRAAELVFGYTLAEVKGRSFTMLAPKDYHPVLNDFLKKAHQTLAFGRADVRHEIDGLCKDGRIFPIELAISGSTHRGQPLLIALVRDISERKKSEQMKASFVSTVSHELRTPLTSINGSLGLVCGGVLGALPPQARTMLDMAYKNSQRLTLLINDLLDLEKMAAGKMRLDMTVQELIPLVTQAIATANVYAKQHQVRLLLSLPVEKVWVRVDANRLQQVLGNLLSNAVKYSTSGDLVELGAEIFGDEGTVRVWVKDRGPGIPVEFRSQIFQKFSQADTSDARRKGGSGLGLSISKELMERMNGLIGYESVPGQGATFYFVLPVWTKSASRLEAAPEVMRAERVDAPRILVIEDNAAAANDLIAILTREGFGVDVAMTGAAALETAKKNQYAAITLDMVLPDQTGVALVRALRARVELDAVPILVISTATEMGKLALQDEFSGIAWLSKPVNEASLLASLKHMSVMIQGMSTKEHHET